MLRLDSAACIPNTHLHRQEYPYKLEVLLAQIPIPCATQTDTYDFHWDSVVEVGGRCSVRLKVSTRSQS